MRLKYRYVLLSNPKSFSGPEDIKVAKKLMSTLTKKGSSSPEWGREAKLRIPERQQAFRKVQSVLHYGAPSFFGLISLILLSFFMEKL